MNLHLNLNYAKFLNKVIPNKNISLFKNELILVVSSKKILPILSFFKNNTNCQYKILTSISSIYSSPSAIKSLIKELWFH